jgi:hypothetical protein
MAYCPARIPLPSPEEIRPSKKRKTTKDSAIAINTCVGDLMQTEKGEKVAVPVSATRRNPRLQSRRAHDEEEETRKPSASSPGKTKKLKGKDYNGKPALHRTGVASDEAHRSGRDTKENEGQAVSRNDHAAFTSGERPCIRVRL